MAFIRKVSGSAIILFGSYSRGEDIASSDIDIAIIGAKKKESSFFQFEKRLKERFRSISMKAWAV